MPMALTPEILRALQGGMQVPQPLPATPPVPVPQAAPAPPLPVQPAQGTMMPPAPSDLGSLVGGQVDPNQIGAQTPPANAQDFAQRVEGWKQTLGRFVSDPNIQRMALFAGASMLQPKRRNQSDAGHVAAAIAGGVDYANTVAGGQRKEAREARALNIKEQEVTGELEIAKDRSKLLRETFEYQKGKDQDSFSLDSRKVAADEKRVGLLAEELMLRKSDMATKMKEFGLDKAAMELKWQGMQLELQRKLLEASKAANKVKVAGDAESGFIFYEEATGKTLYSIKPNWDTNSWDITTLDLSGNLPGGIGAPGSALPGTTGPEIAPNVAENGGIPAVDPALAAMPEEKLTALKSTIQQRLAAGRIDQQQASDALNELDRAIAAKKTSPAPAVTPQAKPGRTDLKSWMDR